MNSILMVSLLSSETLPFRALIEHTDGVCSLMLQCDNLEAIPHKILC
jgi:hypothetical protein